MFLQRGFAFDLVEFLKFALRLISSGLGISHLAVSTTPYLLLA